MRYAMVIDIDKCVGCHTCEISCKMENLTPYGDFRCRLLRVEQERTPYETWLRLSCCHCAKPSCLPACPAGAISKQNNGLVVIDQDACYGCGKCVEVCPYHSVIRSSGKQYFDLPTPYEEMAAPHQRHPKFKSDKCTFCAHRLAKGLQPRCVSACISNALYFGDLDDPEAQVSKLWKEATPILNASGNGPSIALIHKDNKHAQVPELDLAVKNAGPPNISCGLI
ncbi:MAG: 4Fe-4S dicluster domain-containing protein [Deltaproteobacteria bacterium]|jgi:Fe-S-cluster-containing dehydrogenase component|nr:4Fe-4S dicluster domain-containing protein [Deltaproteobacteria bacterium]